MHDRRITWVNRLFNGWLKNNSFNVFLFWFDITENLVWLTYANHDRFSPMYFVNKNNCFYWQNWILKCVLAFLSFIIRLFQEDSSPIPTILNLRLSIIHTYIKLCHLPLTLKLCISSIVKNKLIVYNFNIYNEIWNLLIDADFIILLIYLLLLIPFFLFSYRQHINLFNGIFKEVRFLITKGLSKTKRHFKIPITWFRWYYIRNKQPARMSSVNTLF